MTLIIGLQVILRYVFNYAATWPEEVCRYSMLWLVYCGIILMEKEANHLRVDVIYNHVGAGAKKALDVLNKCVTIFFYGICVWLSIKMLLIVRMTGQTGVGFPIPIWLVWLIIPAGFAVSIIYSIYTIFYKPKKDSQQG